MANPALNLEFYEGKDKEFHDTMEFLPDEGLQQQPLQQMPRVPPEEWPWQQQELQQMTPGPPQEQAWALLQEPRDQGVCPLPGVGFPLPPWPRAH